MNVENNTVQLLASLLDADRRWTVRELAAEVVSQICAPHSARHSGLLQICSMLDTKVQQWHCNAVAQALLNRYQREGDYFLGRIVSMDLLI